MGQEAIKGNQPQEFQSESSTLSAPPGKGTLLPFANTSMNLTQVCTLYIHTCRYKCENLGISKPKHLDSDHDVLRNTEVHEFTSHHL